jgi:hypothetical protein
VSYIAFLREFALFSPRYVPLWPEADGEYDLARAVTRWAPYALIGWGDRLSRSARRIEVLQREAADLGARIDAFERRVARHG